MLRSCSFCGGTHQYGQECPKRIEYRAQSGRDAERRKYDRNSAQDRFRNTVRWRRKRDEIRRRDFCLCKYCFFELGRLTTTGLSVHHIVPIADDYSLRLEDSNLITLCALHHEQAEQGLIKPQKLRALALRQVRIVSGTDR